MSSFVKGIKVHMFKSILALPCIYHMILNLTIIFIRLDTTTTLGELIMKQLALQMF